AISERLKRVGDRRIVDQCSLVVAPREYVTVQRVVTGIAYGAGEPSPVNAGGRIEDLLRFFVPVDVRGRFCPKCLGIALPLRINIVVATGAGVHRRSSCTYCVATGASKQAATQPMQAAAASACEQQAITTFVIVRLETGLPPCRLSGRRRFGQVPSRGLRLRVFHAIAEAIMVENAHGLDGVRNYNLGIANLDEVVAMPSSPPAARLEDPVKAAGL